jgi:hypothetical protein
MVAGGGVTVGHHGATHRHMLRQSAIKNRAEIARATARLGEALGVTPGIFAYPYGEFSLELRNIVADFGFLAAFGQHSGAVSRTADRFALPRFPFSERFGDLDRLRLVINSLPLPATEITPADPLVRPHNNPPLFGFTVAKEISGLAMLDCFASGNEARTERLGERRFEVRLAGPIKPGRTRINCTVPGPDRRWRWLGIQFYMLP